MFLLLDEDEFEQLKRDVEDELSELQEAKAAGEIAGDGGVLGKTHTHKRRKCRPLASTIDCRVRRCEGDGKSATHIACKSILTVPPTGRKFVCLCRQ